MAKFEFDYRQGNKGQKKKVINASTRPRDKFQLMKTLKQIFVFKELDGNIRWRGIFSAVYAMSVWTVIGISAYAFKSGQIKLEEKDTGEVDVMDPKRTIERNKLVAQYVAEFAYKPEAFIG